MSRIHISDIVIGDRHRQDLGDLAVLATSITTEGLLQPIGVTEDNELVFGYRRLIACRDHLGWTEIDIRVVNVTSIVAGEYAENEVRKDFTPSERVAILKAIRAKRPEKRGRPSLGSQKNTGGSSSIFLSRDEEARLAGLGSTTTAHEAELTVDHGIPELVQAMDRGDFGIESAGIIAREPPDVQAAVIALPVKERRQRVNALDAEQTKARAKKRTPPLKRIERPYLKLTVATDEETERPPSDAPLEEHLRWTDRIGAKVPLWSMKAKDLMEISRVLVDVGMKLTAIASDNFPDAERFFDGANKMLMHQVEPDKTAGQQIDFPRRARLVLFNVERDLDKAIAKLEGYRQILRLSASQDTEVVG